MSPYYFAIAHAHYSTLVWALWQDWVTAFVGSSRWLLKLHLHLSISTALMRPRGPKQYCLQLIIYITYVYVLLNLLLYVLYILILHHLDYLHYLKCRINSLSSANSKIHFKVSLSCYGHLEFESLDNFTKFLNKSVCNKPLKLLKILDWICQYYTCNWSVEKFITWQCIT